MTGLKRCIPLLALAALAAAARAEEVKIVRDDFGTPHIFAATDAGASYAMGYAQAEDRLGELHKNFRRATGTMAEFFGQKFYQQDLVMRMVRHREVAEANYSQISERSRAQIEAFVAGVKAYMKEHPDQVPEWAVDIQPWHVVALSRYIIYGWPIGDALDDLKRGNVSLMLIPYRGSNQWIIGPKRTESGVPIALIDPHLSWYDEFRFYEARMYGDTLKVSGVSILGSPLPSLGHSDFCSIAMTTGSGDTADIFEEKLNPENHNQYEVDGKWVDMKLEKQRIGVKQDDGTVKWKEHDIMHTKHGPIVAIKMKDHLGYSIAIPYAESVGLADQIYGMMTAKSLGEAKAALAKLELMGQNVMIATVDGDIYYQRTGKVPIRPAGVDPTKPIPGWLTKNDWLGIHKVEDLVQIENPPQGYMQNNNCSPAYMMKDSPLKLANYPAYVYGCEEGLRHQRALSTLEQLDRDDKWSIEEALELAATTEIRNADKWQARAKEAWANADAGMKANPDAAKLAELIAGWDGHTRADSKGAVAYLFWKRSLPKEVKGGDEYGDPPPAAMTDAMAATAIVSAAGALKKLRGSVEVAYGDIYRVGRREADGSYKKTYPVGGGTPGEGVNSSRAIGFDDQPDGTMVGHKGQTSTQVVMLTKPPKSWTYLPMGESDHKESGHWDDQCEKLFSAGKLKPAYFMDEAGLAAHTKSTKTLQFSGK